MICVLIFEYKLPPTYEAYPASHNGVDTQSDINLDIERLEPDTLVVHI